jgi:hypothetical protein
VVLVVTTALLGVGVAVAAAAVLDPSRRVLTLDPALGGAALDPAIVAVVGVVRLVATVVAFALTAAGTVSWFRGARLHAVRLVAAAQLISLLLIDLMESYVEQFAVLQQSVLDLLVLGLVLRYRVRFLPRTPPVAAGPPEAASPAGAATPGH